MSFRIVKISNRAKLETSLGYLVVRGETDIKILLDEISILIIENQQTCITSALISELMNHKIRVIFCDEKHNPQGEIEPYGICYNSPAKLKQQMDWSENIRGKIWKEIIKQKIRNQSLLLKYASKKDSFDLLTTYYNDVQDNDATNREGLAAKVYFNSLFGMGFDRRNDVDVRNTFLNYGYSLMHSSVNKEISIYGYLNILGIHHIGATNHFNLGSDIMEPLRSFVDKVVFDGEATKENFKKRMMQLLTEECICGDKVMIIQNAITAYVLSVFAALNNNDPSLIKIITFKNE